MPADAWRERAGGLQLRVRVTPRAGRDALESIEMAADGAAHLKVRVKALPTEGAANEAVRRVLAQALGLPSSAVTLLAGQSARRKIFGLRGDPAALAHRLRELAPLPAERCGP